MTMDERDRDQGQDHDPAIRTRLRAYADERLRPEPTAMERVRSQVMAQAREQLSRPAVIPGRTPDAGRLERWRGVLRVRAARSGMALAGAGLALVLAGGGAYAASQPGGPLYGARLWVEGVTLPAGGQARVDADAVRLQERLAEVEAAARSGDATAFADALKAYRDTLTDTLRAAGTDLSKQDRLMTLLTRHLAVLQALVDRLPANAAAAVRQDLARTNETLQGVKNGGGPGNAGNGGQGGAPTSQPGQGAGPAATPRGQGGGPPSTPAGQANQPTPKPTHSPVPHPTTPPHP
ncbi:MAG: hypothetical protein ACXWMX_00485 [Candidatus Limnocylindrales bacterium]